MLGKVILVEIIINIKLKKKTLKPSIVNLTIV